MARLTRRGGAVGKPTCPHPKGEGRRMNCVESSGHDPKPGDLGAGRVKPPERGVEARTGADLQIARMTRV